LLLPMLSKDLGRRAVRRNQFIASLLHREQYVRQTVEKASGKTSLQILKIISEQPTLTIPEIAKMIKKSDSAAERAVRKLREADLVKRIGPAKGGYWLVVKSELKQMRLLKSLVQKWRENYSND